VDKSDALDVADVDGTPVACVSGLGGVVSMAPPVELRESRLIANSAVLLCRLKVSWEDDEDSLLKDAGVKVGKCVSILLWPGCSAAAGESTHKEAKFSITTVEVDVARRWSSLLSFLVSSSSSLFSSDMGLGVKIELVRRFLRCCRRRAALLMVGSDSRASHSASTAELRLVSIVMFSSFTVMTFSFMEYRLRVTSGGRGVSWATRPSTSYSAACGDPNCTRVFPFFLLLGFPPSSSTASIDAGDDLKLLVDAIGDALVSKNLEARRKY